MLPPAAASNPADRNAVVTPQNEPVARGLGLLRVGSVIGLWPPERPGGRRIVVSLRARLHVVQSSTNDCLARHAYFILERGVLGFGMQVGPI